MMVGGTLCLQKIVEEVYRGKKLPIFLVTVSRFTLYYNENEQ